MTTPGQPMNRDDAYRLALMLEARARLDAGTWIARLPRQLSLLARGRFDQVIEPSQSNDPLRSALSREWYVRVFTDHARNQLGLGQVGVEVTPTETEHLAECLRSGIAYRIHGPGGSIVANPDGPTVPGQDNYRESFTERQDDVDDAHGLTDRQNRQVLEALADDQDRRRVEDQQIVGAAWDDLTAEQRTAFAEYWHHQHGTRGHGAFFVAAPAREAITPQPATVHGVDSGQRNVVAGPPADAAAGVFATEAADLAAARAAYALAAQAFPRSQEKPPTITGSGQTRDPALPAPAVRRGPPNRSR